jgi:hypothetical protein
MSKTRDTAAAQRSSQPRVRRTSAGVIAQYIQELSAFQQTRGPRPEARARMFPSRVAPIRC